MKKSIVFIIAFIFINFATFAEIETLIKQFRIVSLNKEIDFKEKRLSEVLDFISSESGVPIFAEKYIEDMKINLHISGNETVENIIETIKKENELKSSIVGYKLMLYKNRNDEKDIDEILKRKICSSKIDYSGEGLYSVLDDLSKKSGIRLNSSTDINFLKIDLYISENKTFEYILETIKKIYALDAVIVENGIMLLKSNKINNEEMIVDISLENRLKEIKIKKEIVLNNVTLFEILEKLVNITGVNIILGDKSDKKLSNFYIYGELEGVLRSLERNFNVHREIGSDTIILKSGKKQEEKNEKVYIYKPISFYTYTPISSDDSIIIEIKNKKTDEPIEGVFIYGRFSDEYDHCITDINGKANIYCETYHNPNKMIIFQKPGFLPNAEKFRILYNKKKYTFYMDEKENMNFEKDEFSKNEYILRDIVDMMNEKNKEKIVYDSEIANLVISFEKEGCKSYIDILEKIRKKYDLEYGVSSGNTIYLKKARIKTNNIFNISVFEKNKLENISDISVCVDGDIGNIRKIKENCIFRLLPGYHKIFFFKPGYKFKEIEIEIINQGYEKNNEPKIIVELENMDGYHNNPEKILINDSEYISYLELPSEIYINKRLSEVAELLSVLYGIPILVEENARDESVYYQNNIVFSRKNNLDIFFEDLKKRYYLDYKKISGGIIINKRILQNSISGVVTELDGITKIPNVEIIINDGRIRIFTDMNGRYKLENIFPGRYPFLTHKQGYKKYEMSINIEEESKLNFDIKIEKN